MVDRFGNDIGRNYHRNRLCILCFLGFAMHCDFRRFVIVMSSYGMLTLPS